MGLAATTRSVINKLFSKYLLATNTISSGCFMATGDIIMQNLERASGEDDAKFAKHDWKRTGRLFIIGLVQGPFNHGWYKCLDHFLPGTAKKTIAKKILLDQIIGSPFFYGLFILGAGQLEGQSIQNSVHEIKTKFWTVYMADWCVWPPAQFINFYFLAPKYRVIYVSGITVIWDSFLSYIKHKDSLEKKTS